MVPLSIFMSQQIWVFEWCEWMYEGWMAFESYNFFFVNLVPPHILLSSSNVCTIVWLYMMTQLQLSWHPHGLSGLTMEAGWSHIFFLAEF
jgi:hypothetical protein